MTTCITKEMVESLSWNELMGAKRKFVELSDEYGVYVTELPITGMLDIIKMNNGSDKSENHNVDMAYLVIAACCVDEEGNQLFTVEQARKMSSKTHTILRDTAMEMNGLVSAPDTKVEDAEKNSEEPAL